MNQSLKRSVEIESANIDADIMDLIVMQPVYYKKSFLRVAEIWFHRPDRPLNADIVRCMQMPDRIEKTRCQAFNTLMIDLTVEKEELLKHMERGTRYEIRRAQTKDALNYETVSAKDIDGMREFSAAYEKNVASRNDALKLNLSKLSSLAENDRLDLSVVTDSNKHALTWHMYIVSDSLVRLLYSVSGLSNADDQERRNLYGRANRLHHWLDMQRFRGEGYRQYDFGGYYSGDSDNKKLQINNFKKGFGGAEVLTYNCMYPLTFRGRIALAAWRLLNKEAN